MIVIRDPALTSGITDPDIRSLVDRRFIEIFVDEPYDCDIHGYMILVEPGDTVAALEQETSCYILRNRFDDSRFGDADFSPGFEVLEEHAACYEMVYIMSDDGFGIDMFIPKQSGIDAELLAMCAQYAFPALT